MEEKEKKRERERERERERDKGNESEGGRKKWKNEKGKWWETKGEERMEGLSEKGIIIYLFIDW